MYFRASTTQRARALALRGYAENAPDGSVLVLAGGSAGALDELVQWLHTGPSMARVDRVDVEVIDPATMKWPSGFLPR